MKKVIFAIVVLVLLALAPSAEAKTKHSYGYTLHHSSVIKCPYYSCHKSFRHK